MERWCARPDRPYMRRGITLQNLADDLHLPLSLLLRYGYLIHGTTFRQWIRTLRQKQE